MTTESEKKSLYIENRAALLERTLRLVARAKARKGNLFAIRYLDRRGREQKFWIAVEKIEAIAKRFEQDLMQEGQGARVRRIKEAFGGTER